MTNYTKTTDFAAKDSLPSGDSGKIIRGAEFGTEFDNIQTAVNSKSNIENPSFTGNITVTGTVDGRDIAADGTKLDTIETSADVTDTANVTAAGAVMDSELTNITAVKALNQGVATTDSPTFAAVTSTGNVTVGGTVDGRDVAADGTKLDGIEAGATADQTPAQIKTAYESNANTNAFTDADHTKLDGIEASADVTDTTNVTAAGALMDSELTDIAAVKALNQGVATTDSPTFAGATVNGTVEFDGLSGTGAVTVTDILDQDNMSSNSATALATQQSIKSYVDSQVATSDTLAEVLANGNTTGGTDVAFGDNDKAIFGAGSDLEIYHSSNQSIIKESGAGSLLIQGDNIRLQKVDGSENMITAVNDGAVTLFDNGSAKLATSSTGIDVTGVITTDGMTTSADINFGDNDKAVFGAGSDLQIYHTGSVSLIKDAGTGGLYLGGSNLISLGSSDFTETYALFNDDGAVSLRYDNATKLATSATGIDVTGGITSSGNLTVNGADVTITANIIHSGDSDTYFGFNANDSYRVVTGGTQRLLVNSSGIDVTGTVSADGLVSSGSAKIGTGVASNSAKLMVNTGAGESAGIQLFQDGTESWVMQNPASTTALTFSNSNTERLKISNNGDMALYEDTGTTAKFFWDSSAESLGIGTSSISTSKLHVQGTTGTASAVRVESTAADSDAYYIADNDASVWTWGIDGGNGDAWTLSNAFGLGTPKLTVETSGNVGIGTTTPNYALDIETSGALFRLNATSGDATAQLSVADTTSLNIINFGDSGSTTSGQILYRHNGDSMAFNTAGSEAMRIDSAGQVGIATSSPSGALDIGGQHVLNDNYDALGASFTRNGAYGSVLSLGRQGVSSGVTLDYPADNTFALSTNSSEAMRIDSSGHLIVPNGVTLGTAVGTYAAANTLDDYEEGTFTPELADAPSGGNVATVGTATGTYVKIGSQVTIQVFLANIATTGMTAGSALFVRGLPFTAQGTTYAIGAVEVQRINFSEHLNTRVNGGSAYFRLSEMVPSGDTVDIKVSDLTSGSADIFTTITYEV